MPKHLLLSMTLRHLTGSAEIITLINRYGHCMSYSQVLELENAMGIQVQQQNNILPTNISIQGNKFSHFCWDNFDINEETPSGAGTTHSTHGIIIQEIIENHFPEMPLETVAPHAKDRKLTYTPTILPPCFAKKRVEPTVTASTSIIKVIVPPNN